ncbi:MAG: hypothetical protein ACPLPR_02265 [Bacillota bacterium]
MPKSKKRVHKDVFMVQDGNVTHIEGIYDVPSGQPASRAVVNKRSKERGLWMEIELVDDEPPTKKPVK